MSRPDMMPALARRPLCSWPSVALAVVVLGLTALAVLDSTRHHPATPPRRAAAESSVTWPVALHSHR